MATYTVRARLYDRPTEIRLYEAIETGAPWVYEPYELSAGGRHTGGLLVVDPNGGYIGNFRNWAWFVAFLGQMRAFVVAVDGLAQPPVVAPVSGPYTIVTRIFTGPTVAKEIRRFTVTPTGDPWVGGGPAPYTGGLRVADERGHVANVPSWAHFVALLGTSNAMVVRVDGLEEDEPAADDAAMATAP